MHLANASACLISFACVCAFGLPPLGISDLHTFWAFTNWAELGSTPVFWPFCIDDVILIRPWLSGSGKFGTPCLRMQAAKAAGSPLPEPPGEALLVLVLFVVTCATPALGEPP